MNSKSKYYYFTLADYFANRSLYLDEPTQKKPNVRKCVELPFQQTKAQLWDEVTNTLCNLDFIQAKACAKMTYDLVRDFNDVLEVIPDNSENIRQEKARHARMEKYTMDLIACAKGEIRIDELEIPESITPWSKEKIDAEIEHLKTSPKKADILKDFLNFLGDESSNLQSFASDFAHFTHQQAWNYTNEGFLGKAAEQTNPEVLSKLFLRASTTRPPYIPFPQILKKLRGHNDSVVSVNMNAEGLRAVSCSKRFLGLNEGVFIFWDLKTGQPLKSLLGSTAQGNYYYTFLKLNRAMFTTGEKYMVICDIETDQLYSFPKVISTVACVNSNGKFLLEAEKEVCYISNMETGQVTRLTGSFKYINALSVTPDGKLALLAVDNNTCILYDLASCLTLKTLIGHTDSVKAVYMTPDGKLAISGSYDNTCIVWDLGTGQVLQTLRGHNSLVEAVSITPDGQRAISGSTDETCILWNTETGKVLKTLNGHSGTINSVSITPDGQFALSGSNDSTCILWNLGKSQETSMHYDQLYTANELTVSHDGKYALSGTHNHTCMLWDLESGQILKTLKGQTDIPYSEVRSICICPDNKHALSGSDDSTCILWNMETGQALKKFTGHTLWIQSVCVTPDNNRALSGSHDSTCILWNLKTGHAIETLRGHDRSISALILTLDGRYAISGSENHTCVIWDLENGQALKTLEGHRLPVNSIEVFPDGKCILTASYSECLLWNLETGKVLKTLRGHTDAVKPILLTPDGKHALSNSSENNCLFWDMKTGNLLRTFIGHTKTIKAISITPDGKHAVSGSEDNTCILWDIETGQILSRYVGAFPIEKVSVFPKGIICGGQNSETVILYIDQKILTSGHGIVTVRRIWDFENHKYLDVCTECPLCGHRFAPPPSVLVTVGNITKKAGLKPEQSPCLELPDEAWEEPGLLGSCPNCHAELKFNPFIAGGDNKPKQAWKFWER